MKKYKSGEIFEFSFEHPSSTDSIRLFKVVDKVTDLTFDDYVLEVLGIDDKFHLCEKRIITIKPSGKRIYCGVCRVSEY